MTYHEWLQTKEAQQIKERCRFVGYRGKELEEVLMSYYKQQQEGYN